MRDSLVVIGEGSEADILTCRSSSFGCAQTARKTLYNVIDIGMPCRDWFKTGRSEGIRTFVRGLGANIVRSVLMSE